VCGGGYRTPDCSFSASLTCLLIETTIPMRPLGKDKPG
jgi:hypothetical protein